MKSLVITLLLACSAFSQNQKATVTFNPPPIFGQTNYFSQPNFSIDPNFFQPKTNFYTYSQTLNGYLASSSASGSARMSIDNMYRGVKIDSFNPNGASNLTDGLISGALNLIFNGNSGRSNYIKL